MDRTSKFITLEEVAELYSLPITTLRRWASERRFPLYRISNRIRVSDEEFRKWIEGFKINVEEQNV